MIVLTYIGVFLFCYGIYNMLCYIFVMPTVKSARGLQGKKNRYLCNNALIIALAEKIVTKWELDRRGSEKQREILQYNEIYYPVAVYCVSLILTVICGLFLCLPLLLWDMKSFLILVTGIFISILADPFILYIRYQRSIAAVKPADLANGKWKNFKQKSIRLLPGVFFLCQMVLFIALLT